MASSAGLEPLVESHIHENAFLKKGEFPCANNLMNALPGPPEAGTASW